MDKYLDLFDKYKNIINCCLTIEDSLSIINNLNISDDLKNILYSYAKSKFYINNNGDNKYILNINDLKNIINISSNIKYREDTYNYINNIIKNLSDITQIKTLTRIANDKPLKPNNNIKNNNIIYINKKCPHCSKSLKYDSESSYVICGYGLNGYDWEGCGKDWCFKCGKKLCKSWEKDKLFILENRLHNKDCCKKHSIINKNNYNIDYCQCSNKNVNRLI